MRTHLTAADFSISGLDAPPMKEINDGGWRCTAHECNDIANYPRFAEMTQQTRHNKFVSLIWSLCKHKIRHRDDAFRGPQKRARRRQRWHCAIILLLRVILRPHYQIISDVFASQVSRDSSPVQSDAALEQIPAGIGASRDQKTEQKRTKNRERVERRKTKGKERTFNVLQWNDQHKFHRLAPFSGDGLFIHLSLSLSCSLSAVSIQKNIIIFMLYSEEKAKTRRFLAFLIFIHMMFELPVRLSISLADVKQNRRR